LGCAIAAARAEGIDLIDLRPENRVYTVKSHHETILASITDEDRKARIKKWKMAVERSFGWVTTFKDTSMTSKSLNDNDMHHSHTQHSHTFNHKL